MKKIGIFLPSRPVLAKVSHDKPGIFLESVADCIVQSLRGSFEVVEGLDFRKASVVDGEVFFGDFAASQLAGYLWFSHMERGSDGHDLMLLEQLERKIPIINPSGGLRIGLDKFKTSCFLKARGIPVPEFALIHKDDERLAGKIISKWGSVLAKPRYGGFGIGIFRTSSADELLDLLDFSGLDSIYVERFHENNMDDWCGVNVVGGRVLCGYGKQEGKIRGYKVLDRKGEGGGMVERRPNSEQAGIALQVAQSTCMDFFGVDIIKSRESGYLVVDMNTFPGIYPDIIDPKKVGSEFLRMVSDKIGV